MDPKTMPSDLERLIKHMKMLGWVPRKFGKGKNKYEVEYSNGTFYVNLERLKSARIRIEFEDFWDE